MMRFAGWPILLSACLLSTSSAWPVQVRQLSDLLNPVLTAVSKLTGPVLDTVASSNLPGSSILNPLLEVVQQTASGQGLVQGVLGGLDGVLGEEQTFDYVIVGGGTAGIPVGVRLAEAGFTVAIVEAGLFYQLGKPVLGTTPTGAFFGAGWNSLDQFPLVDWGFTTEPQEGTGQRRLHYARGKALGGTSALNFMIYHRSSSQAYDMWADQVGDDSYRLVNLQPYFEKSVSFTPPNTEVRPANATTLYDANDFTTPGGPVQVSYTNFVSTWTSWLEQGLKSVGMKVTTEFNSGKLLGYHYAQATIRPETQSRSASDDYLRLIEDTSKLKVFTQTTAKQIIFNGTTAVGVKVNTLALLERTIYASKEVILSAGAFQSPHLLMVSGIGPKSTLDSFGIPVVSALEGVGQNMWDHIFLGPTHEVAFDTLSKVFRDPVVLAETLADYLAVPPTGPLTSNVAELIGWEKLPEKYRSTWSEETRAAMSQFPPDWPEIEVSTANAYIGDFMFPLLQQPLNFNQYATIFGIMNALTSRGNITITSSDINDAPIITPNYLTTKADQEVAVSWFRRMREIWDTPELQSITIKQDDGSAEYWPGPDVDTDEEILDLIRSSFMTVWHASCTCKMGKREDSMAVVDSGARVFGVEKLRVVDASSFPLLPPGHLQSTIYALAEKIADDIVQGR